MVKLLYVVKSVVRAPFCAQPGFELPSDQPDVVPENDVTNASLNSRAGPSAATVRENHKRSQSSLPSSTRDRPEARTKRVRTDAGRTAKQFTSADERGS